MAREDVWVIGTEPPCPRCDYLARMVQDVVNTANLPLNVRHIDYLSDEAVQFAASLGLTPGTAKDVARKAGVAIDWNAVQAMISPSDRSVAARPQGECCAMAADKWSVALDEMLRPCEQKALEAGILMTPVFVVNGRLVHNGSVPSRKQVESWLRQGAHDLPGSKPKHVVEVLGSGCPRCQILFDNTVEAIKRSGLSEQVAVVKRTDIEYFQQLGLTMTPGLVINGQIVSKGQVLGPHQIGEYLNAQVSSASFTGRG